MTTVINSPSDGNGSDGAASMVLGGIILIVLVVLFFVYALPAIRGSDAPQEAQQSDSVDVNVTIPANTVPANDATDTDDAADTDDTDN